MALLERVSTLIRANLNDLVEKAEDPEKLLKQVILDMQNQLLQVKTQVAIAIADQHLLEKKQTENQDKHGEWMRKAEMAVHKKNDEELGRAALERALSYKNMAESFTQQVADQKTQVENLKTAFSRLEQKLAEAQAKCDLLVAQHRRTRTAKKAGEAHAALQDGAHGSTFDRMKHKVQRAEAIGEAHAELNGDTLDDRFATLEKEDEIERLLAEIKAGRTLNA
jgi:phage shock protein A